MSRRSRQSGLGVESKQHAIVGVADGRVAAVSGDLQSALMADGSESGPSAGRRKLPPHSPPNKAPPSYFTYLAGELSLFMSRSRSYHS